MNICLGISGSIASYRSPDFLKKLVGLGHSVRCVLTESATHFVTEKTLETFSANKVYFADAFGAEHMGTDHIALARWADLFVVYGATANFLSRAAAGAGDDFLSLQLLAFKGPVWVVPAMNPQMWENPLIQNNYLKLKNAGFHFVDPIAGKVACGEVGVGHVASDEEILEKIFSKAPVGRVSEPVGLDLRAAKKISSEKVLISLGAMRTAMDSARFLQNRSSGKMGLSLVRAYLEGGVKKLTALVGLVDPVVEKEFADLSVRFSGFQWERFSTVKEYKNLLDRYMVDADVFLSAAAVLDFEIETNAKKLDRSEISKKGELSFSIKPTEDLVALMGKQKSEGQKIIAFAAESGSDEEVVRRATEKMHRKKADLIVANPIREGLGPDANENLVWVVKGDAEPIRIGPEWKGRMGNSVLNAIYL